MSATWSVLVVYRDTQARETALAFCDCLVERFWAQAQMDFSWWDFDQLRHYAECREALRKACQANIVVFTTDPGSGLPSHIRRWTENWVHSRGEREGVLASLNTRTLAAPTEPQLFLRRMAHQAGMDFLTEVPSGLSFLMPESVDSCLERASQRTSTLDSILRQRPRQGH